MKFVKTSIALALIAFSGSSAVVIANDENTVQTNVSVTAYVAAGLTVSVSPLEFGHIVKPAGGAGPNEVSIACASGAVTYTPTSGSPSGTASNAQNANFLSVVPAAGSLIIGGEDNYAISVSVGNGGLDSNGDATIAICGTLEVDESASASTAVNLVANVTVNYR